MSGYYAFYDNYGTPVGFAADYRTGQTHKFKISGTRSSKVNTEALERFKQEAKESQEHKWLKVSDKAQTIWGVALPCDSHPYLSSKGVASHSLRSHKGNLIIPILDETGKLWSLQMIGEDGAKDFYRAVKQVAAFTLLALTLLKKLDRLAWLKAMQLA